MKFAKAMKKQGFDYEETFHVIELLLDYVHDYGRKWKRELLEDFDCGIYRGNDTFLSNGHTARGVLQAVRNELYDEVVKLSAPKLYRMWHFLNSERFDAL